MKVPVGISNRHVHLTEQDFRVLFGDVELTEKARLNQPSDFASNEVVTLKSEKTEIKNVRILGPFRKYTQVEISATDARTLGIKPPVRASGDVENAGALTIVGPLGSVVTTGCILPQRHIHITCEDKERLGLPDVVSVVVDGEKGGVLDQVHVKCIDNSYFELHIDTDEGNAFQLRNGQEVEIKF